MTARKVYLIFQFIRRHDHSEQPCLDADLVASLSCHPPSVLPTLFSGTTFDVLLGPVSAKAASVCSSYRRPEVQVGPNAQKVLQVSLPSFCDQVAVRFHRFVRQLRRRSNDRCLLLSRAQASGQGAISALHCQSPFWNVRLNLVNNPKKAGIMSPSCSLLINL